MSSKKKRQRRRGLAIAALFLATLTVIVSAALFFGNESRDQDGEMVWSEAHGHYHRR